MVCTLFKDKEVGRCSLLGVHLYMHFGQSLYYTMILIQGGSYKLEIIAGWHILNR